MEDDQNSDLGGEAPAGLMLDPRVAAARLFWSQPCALDCSAGWVRDPEQPSRLTYCACPKGSRRKQLDSESRERDLAERRAVTLARIARRLDTLPDEYREFTLASSPLAPHPVMAQTRAWLASFTGDQNFILRGDVGVGKTGILVGILRELTPWLADRGLEFVLVDSVKLTRQMNDAMRGREDVGDLLASYARVGVLAIDDVGVEGSLTSVTASYWYELLNDRHVAHRATLMTTNLATEQLEAFLGERVIDRLNQRGTVLQVGKSRNIRKLRVVNPS